MPTLQDKHLYQDRKYADLVNPNIVRSLCLQGLDLRQYDYRWRLIEGSNKVFLRCHLFDTDDYYSGGQSVIDRFTPNHFYIPAYCQGDMEMLLPDFYVERMNGKYTISIDAVYQVEAVTADRLPDAFALMVYDCLKARVIDIDKALKQLAREV